MDLNLTTTLAVVVLVFALFGFANYHVVQMVCIVVILLMAAHLVSIVTGRPFTGQQGGT